jgi:hypothetical protein
MNYAFSENLNLTKSSIVCSLNSFVQAVRKKQNDLAQMLDNQFVNLKCFLLICKIPSKSITIISLFKNRLDLWFLSDRKILPL